MRLLMMLLALATPIIAFIVPEGLPDGDYDVVRWTEKSPLFLKRRTSLSDEIVAKLQLEKHKEKKKKAGGLGSTLKDFLLSIHYHKQGTRCDNNVPNDHYVADYIKAKRSFKNRCAQYKYAHFYASVSVTGNAVVYTCGKNSPWRQCSDNDFEFAHKDLDATCGNPSGGRIFAQRWNQEFGRSWRGANVCSIDDTKDVLNYPKSTFSLGKGGLEKKLWRKLGMERVKASRSRTDGRSNTLLLREGNFQIRNR